MFEMDIAICLDNNFAFPCEVMLISLFENNRNDIINIHALTNDLSENNRSRLKKVCHGYERNINFYDIHIDLSYCPLIKGRYTLSTYFRILLPDILPNISKILYLDSDIIVCNEIFELWNTDISNYSCAAVVDLQAQSMPSIFNRLQYGIELKYFNAGVLLINLEFWRKYKLKECLLNYIELNYERIKIVDQDALNYILRESKLLLPYKYNVQDSFYRMDCICAKQDEYKIQDSIMNPVILHFSFRKPWQFFCLHPQRKYFYKYVKKEWLIKYMINSFTYRDVLYLFSLIFYHVFGVNVLYKIYRYKNISKK